MCKIEQLLRLLLDAAETQQNLCRPGGDMRFIFLLRLGGQQDPECVDADRRPEWDIEQRNESQHQRDDPSPGLALQQPPSRDESARGFGQYQETDDAYQRTQELGRRLRRRAHLMQMSK